MRIVKGASDPAVAAGNAIAVVIDVGTSYPETPAGGTKLQAKVIAIGQFDDGQPAIVFELVAVGANQVPIATGVPAGEVAVGELDPISFVAQYGIGLQ